LTDVESERGKYLKVLGTFVGFYDLDFFLFLYRLYLYRCHSCLEI
jgi:hypothetical protein